MKLTIAATVLASIAPAVLAGLPEGFYEQCCVKPYDGEVNVRRQLGNLNALKGYNVADGSIDLLCQTAGSATGVEKVDEDDVPWTCYDYEEICDNTSGLFAPFTPSATNEICDNNANCYNPNTDNSDCDGDVNGFPDIYWSCFSVPSQSLQGTGVLMESFHCGFECKFVEICGDPHFETFDGKWFDFHGECDLVLIKAEEFGMGLGLDIHVRTKGRYEYSFIESAAIKIGDDILEVSSYGAYSFNGVSGADLSSAKFADMYRIEHEVRDAQTSEYTIRTGGNEFIKVKSFKDLVSVRASNATAYNFASSEGMMGDFFQGKMLARDGSTVIANADDFGLEWQVVESDPKLFVTESPVTGKCIMPSERVSEGRRLGASAINKEAAMTACAHVEGAKFDNCVYDVVALGDLDAAKSY